jgi:DnaK suppressor protein
MNPIEIEQLKQRLQLQRQEILQFLNRVEREMYSIDDHSPQDSADQCVASVSKESLFERTSQQRTMLRLIQAALRRIQGGSFGMCATCGEVIKDRRLLALPWAQFCLRCQEVQEFQEATQGDVRPHSDTHVPPATAETWKRAG